MSIQFLPCSRVGWIDFIQHQTILRKFILFITPVNKYLKDVILSSAKNLVFSFSYEILHFVQDDNYS
jgi:hypothetical protein